MKPFLLIIALNLIAIETLWGQDPVFSQFYSSSLYLNPALSGLEKDVVLGFNYRSQWAGVGLPFKTFQFSAIHPILQQGVKTKHLGGFGATLFTDEAGPNREVLSQGLSIASSYNFHFDRTGNHLLAAALQFGVIQRRINFDALQWSSQYSTIMGYDPSMPGETLGSDRITRPVIHAGAIWRRVIDSHFQPMKIFYQGFAVSNINRPKGFFINEREASVMLVKIHGGYVHSFNNGFEISPNYLLQIQNGSQINVGGYGAYALPAVTSKSMKDLKLSAGFWYRVKDSFILTTGISTASWTAGFSYDANTSSLERNFQGANSYEFSFAYRIQIIKEYKRFATPLL
jgi:type IX secretion system PorP/SprF family membrane protein